MYVLLGELRTDRGLALCYCVPRGNSSSWGCWEGQQLWQSHWGGTWSGGLASSADQHLLQTGRNVPVASAPAFIRRGAERLWGGLMGCKELFPLCLLGSSPRGAALSPTPVLTLGRSAWECTRTDSSFTSRHQHLGPSAPQAAPALVKLTSCGL